MINLNDSQFADSKIFNNGKAVLVKDVTLSVEKNESDSPAFWLTLTDTAGATLKQGFFYFSPNPAASEADVERSRGYEVGRLVHLARAVMGDNAELPEVKNAQDALDVVMKLIRDNAGSNKFNVFDTYETVNLQSQYLKLRRFRFIEPAGSESTTLLQGAKDNMERVQPDSPSNQETGVEAGAANGWS